MLNGKVVIITGGAKGIGRYTAQTFVKAGAKLALVDVDIARLHTTGEELRALGGDVLPLTADVRSEGEVKSAVDKAVQRFGRVDVLVNNAAIVPHFMWGIPRWANIKEMEQTFWDRVIDTNLGGTFRFTKHVWPQMERQRSGHIINLYGGGGGPGAAAYVISKEAIKTFSQFVAVEEQEYGICVVTVNPGAAIATEDAPEEARQRMPAPSFVGERFVLAAQVGMEYSGKLLTMENGKLIVES